MKIDKEGLIHYFQRQIDELEELERKGLLPRRQSWDRKWYLKRTIEAIHHDWHENPHLFQK